MKWKLDKHINGKVYDLTQQNMNKMIADIEMLNRKVEVLKYELEQALGAFVDYGIKCVDYEVALELIATPPRPDGTYNRSRKACEKLAKKVLAEYRKGEEIEK